MHSGWKQIQFLRKTFCFSLTLAMLLPVAAHAQARTWHLIDGDQAHDNWQVGESKITTDTVQKNFQLLWKLKLSATVPPQNFSEFVFTPSMITSRGFKDSGVIGDATHLYAVDYALGTLLWKKEFAVTPAAGCTLQKMQISMDPPRIIRFGATAAKPAAKPATPAPAAPPPPDAAHRWIGAPTQGGGFGLKGIYAITSDGVLHEQNMANGLDYAPSAKFILPEAGSASAINMNERLLYTETINACGKAANAVWSIDLSSPAHEVNSRHMSSMVLQDSTGPAIGPDGTVYVAAAIPGDAHTGYTHNVMSLAAKTLSMLDYFAVRETSPMAWLNISPVLMNSGDTELVAAAGPLGSIALLDAKSLGGTDHHTPLAQTATLATETKKGAWEGLASWHDKSGALWVLASIAGPVSSSVQFAKSNGSVSHGSIVAFKVETASGKFTLTPEWISHDLINPAPPVIANGVVFALSSGDATTHAVLYALDADTGKELYSSGTAVESYSHLSGLSVGDGHVFFTTHDNTLYSFGIPLEH